MENILSAFVGHDIQKVTYFELNDPDQPFLFEGFDNCDLGIEIEFYNSSCLHIGWKDSDCHEIGLGKYHYAAYHEDVCQFDATGRWSQCVNTPIRTIEVIYVSEEWKIPAKCTFTFENGHSVSIVLGEELNLDGTLPLPLKHNEGAEIYVFFGTELPNIEFVRIEQAPEYFIFKKERLKQTEPQQFPKDSYKVTTQVILMVGFILWIVYLILKYSFS